LEKHVVYAGAQNDRKLPWKILRDDQWQASIAFRRFEVVARQ
jgi:hypothetical protein